MTTDGRPPPRASVPLRRRLVPALGLLVLAPISAEHLLGYDDTIGHPDVLLAALFIFGPLYGGPALIIRETARRTGRGWRTMLLLGFAFGLVQAGLLDMSLFNPNYRGIPYWEALVSPTQIAGAGLSASMVLNFVVNHMIRSYCAPIAIIEACVPRLAGRPWLGKVGLAVVSTMYVAAAAFIVIYRLDTEQFTPSIGQVVTTALIVVALVVAAFVIPPQQARSTQWVPTSWLVGCIAVATLAVHLMVPATWPGFAVDLLALTVLGGLVFRWSGRTSWGPRHVLAVAGASLLIHAALAFMIQPLGNPSPTAKYTTNIALAAVVLGLLAWAHAKVRPREIGAVTAGWLTVAVPACLAALIVSTALAGPCSELMVMGGTVCTSQETPRVSSPMMRHHIESDH